jgi:hypothetical protein
MPPGRTKIADKPIRAVLAEFLVEQSERLKSDTFAKYRSIVELLQAHIDGYAYGSLDQVEKELWDELFNAGGAEHREFCEIFGPEKIPENIGMFLGDFMPRKVACGKELLRAAGTVVKKLGKWLADKSYIDSEIAKDMADSGARASRDLPAAEGLSEMLRAYASKLPAPAGEYIEGYFYVTVIGSESLGLEDMDGGESMIVPVPRQAAKVCQPGWTISGSVCESADGWRLAEVWNVYI